MPDLQTYKNSYTLEIGEARMSDLLGIQVYKFRMVNPLCLLACRVLDEYTIKILMAGKKEWM